MHLRKNLNRSHLDKPFDRPRANGYRVCHVAVGLIPIVVGGRGEAALPRAVPARTRSGRYCVQAARQEHPDPDSRSVIGDYSIAVSASAPRSRRPYVHRFLSESIWCWVAVWMSRKQRCSGLEVNTELPPPAL